MKLSIEYHNNYLKYMMQRDGFWTLTRLLKILPIQQITISIIKQILVLRHSDYVM